MTLPFELTPRKSSARYACATEGSWVFTDASHLSSMSRIVASGVPFLLGITAAAEAVVDGASLAVLLADGDEDFFGEADASTLGLGDAVFSVATDTVVSEAEASGDAAGDGLSSWATANRAPANSVVRARTVIFIWFSLVDFEAAPERG